MSPVSPKVRVGGLAEVMTYASVVINVPVGVGVLFGSVVLVSMGVPVLVGVSDHPVGVEDGSVVTGVLGEAHNIIGRGDSRGKRDGGEIVVAAVTVVLVGV